MKKINFICPKCGGHKLMGAKPLQWIQFNAIGFDDDGELLFDHDRPSIVDSIMDDDVDLDFEIYCNDCHNQFSLELIEEMFNSND